VFTFETLSSVIVPSSSVITTSPFWIYVISLPGVEVGCEDGTVADQLDHVLITRSVPEVHDLVIAKSLVTKDKPVSMATAA
jgi:hypothetical protein